jgi:hypothetical protein
MGDVTAPPAASPPRRASPRRTAAELMVRRGLLLVVAAAALTAVLGGLARLGLPAGWGHRHAVEHGPLFVLGVFGTVIALERAVALARPWSLAAPALGAVAAVGMLAGLAWAPWAAVAASLALVVVNVAIVRRQAVHFTWLMLLGSAVLAFGAVRWALGRPVFEVVATWIGFFVLTIAAERLELSRLAPTPRWAHPVLIGLAALLAALACARALGVDATTGALGGVLALIGAWQLAFDLARRTIRQRGLARFAAAGVLLGAAWLLATGAVLAGTGLPPVGPIYDAVLHGVFVGYVLSMVFAHALIILPAVARISVPFSPVLYAPLAVLHLGLAARVAGDLAGDAALRRGGTLATAVALGLFALTIVSVKLIRGRAAAAAGRRRR